MKINKAILLSSVTLIYQFIVHHRPNKQIKVKSPPNVKFAKRAIFLGRQGKALIRDFIVFIQKCAALAILGGHFLRMLSFRTLRYFNSQCPNPAGIYLLKVNNGNTWALFEIYSNLTIKFNRFDTLFCCSTLDFKKINANRKSILATRVLNINKYLSFDWEFALALISVFSATTIFLMERIILLQISSMITARLLFSATCILSTVWQCKKQVQNPIRTSPALST